MVDLWWVSAVDLWWVSVVGFQRPIIVKFLNFKSKIDALRNSYKLKNLESPKVWLEEDFSPSVQFARKKLREFAKSNRTDNERFSVRFNKLHLQGKVYHFDSARGVVAQASGLERPAE